jgi:hypothetical protein
MWVILDFGFWIGDWGGFFLLLSEGFYQTLLESKWWLPIEGSFEIVGIYR